MCMLCAAGYPLVGETITSTSEASGIALAGWAVVGGLVLATTIKKPVVIHDLFLRKTKKLRKSSLSL